MKKRMVVKKPFVFLAYFGILIVLTIDCVDFTVPKLSPAEIAIYKCSDKYGIPSSLLKGIRYAESVNGKFLWSNSKKIVSKQDWVRRIPAIKKLYQTYGDKIFYCIGDMQVLYLTAYCYGYCGDPNGLLDIETNMKYASLILRDYLDMCDPYINSAIAAYNAGEVNIVDGRYRNEDYVMRVWKIYTNQFPGGWQGE